MRSLTALLLCGISTGANAQYLGGNDAYSLCSRNVFALQMFVAGVASAAALAASDAEYIRKGISAPKLKAAQIDAKVEILADIQKVIKPYCQPRNVTVGQMSDVVCKYMKENPAKRSNPSALIVKMALHEAWPCEPDGPAE